jgi:hypothetical protein
MKCVLLAVKCGACRVLKSTCVSVVPARATSLLIMWILCVDTFMMARYSPSTRSHGSILNSVKRMFVCVVMMTHLWSPHMLVGCLA